MKTHEFEIRDPIHGMIPFSSLEREVINHEAFQRLRRIRQLSWTDYIYPGAMHTRFHHTLGVMHLASRAFEALVQDQSSREILRSEFSLDDGVIERQKIIIRLAALVHDLGHSPFSHAAETLMPLKTSGSGSKDEKLYDHEDYSVAIFRDLVFPAIENHPDISSRGISLREITGLIEKTPANPLGAICKEIISGRIDADRMDYLLRDSYYCGVRYGHYEMDRLLNTICVCEDSENETFTMGIKEDGLHAAEGLLLARYMMFHNVYFHKTRVIYDYHFQEAMRDLLGKSGVFPKPSGAALKKYLQWDDWRVLGRLSDGGGGIHGEVLRSRNHFRLKYHTSESFGSIESRERAFEDFEDALRDVESAPHYVWEETKSFSADFPVLVENNSMITAVPLTEISGVVKSLRPLNQKRLYVASSAD